MICPGCEDELFNGFFSLCRKLIFLSVSVIVDDFCNVLYVSFYLQKAALYLFIGVLSVANERLCLGGSARPRQGEEESGGRGADERRPDLSK